MFLLFIILILVENNYLHDLFLQILGCNSNSKVDYLSAYIPTCKNIS